MGNRRNRRIVETFQIRLCARIIAYAIVFQLTVWNLMFCLHLIHSNANFLDAYRDFFHDSWPMLACVMLLAPAFAWDAVRYCHRVAGPVYRIRQSMRNIAAGQPMRHVKLRAQDELTAMQDDFNAMLDALARRGAITLIDPPLNAEEASAQPPPALRLAR
jgi:HAMP domain-containing protein